MINLNLMYFLNLFSTGLLFMAGFAVLFTGHRKLNPPFHSFYWFLNFAAVLFYNLEFTGRFHVAVSISSYIYMIIPLMTAVYFYSLLHEKLSFKFILLILSLSMLIFLENRIILFQVFYTMLILTVLTAFSSITYIKERKRKDKNDRKKLYLFFFVQFIVLGFVPYIVVNTVLSITKGYPVHLKTILPFPISISALAVYFLYYHFSQYYNNEDLRENNIQEKMSLIEKIAASIIHEIKNPLSAIQSLNSQLSERRTSMSEESIEKYHSIIDKDIKRIKGLTDTFLSTFKDKENDENDQIEPFIVLQSILDLIRFDILKKEVTVDIEKSLIDIRINCNNYYFRQVFLNLIYNAMEADAKRIVIKAETDRAGVNIFIKDDGSGIKIHDFSKIFLPFYTTKPEGTGLGLSICRKILDRYNGSLKLISSCKGETVFCVNFRGKVL